MSSGRSSAADADPSAGDGAEARRDVAVIIPAYDEASTVGVVVAAALASGLGPVLVVDDGSRDGTADAAAAAGARVLRLPRNAGKGGALAAGAASLGEAVIVLLDADLVGLTGTHVRDLAAPVLAGTCDMSRGVFRGGRLGTTLAQRLTPQLNGQRCLRREALLAVPGLATSRYGVEIAITRHAAAAGWRVAAVPLWGVTQVMKEEKRGFLAGVAVRLRMYGEVLAALLARRGGRR